MQAAKYKTATADGSLDMVDTVVAAGKFSILSNALRATGLVATLKSAGPFTLFAPTDEAFRKLPSGTVEKLLKDRVQLAAIVRYHLLPVKLMVDELHAGDRETIQGSMLNMAITDAALMVDDAKVTKTAIEASNGVIYAIDKVMMPRQSVASLEDKA